MNSAAEFILLSDDRGLRYSLPASWACISTYVLMEQRRWFEREVEFLYRFVTPGMFALDIGANVGVYSLPFGKLAGPTGRVYAYEPNATNRSHLERSLTLNDLDNVVVCAAALSNFTGRGYLRLGESGELHQLVSSAGEREAIETVEVNTLDVECLLRDWPRLDFVKLDAEGQEQAILEGGVKFLQRYSPLVMVEVKHCEAINLDLLAMLRDSGFNIYRLLGDASMLVPFNLEDEMDPSVLNLFAARLELASELEVRGLLAKEEQGVELNNGERAAAIDSFCAMPFAKALEITPQDVEGCPFANALISHSAQRFIPQLPPNRRRSLLRFAFEEMRQYCATSDSEAALSSFARIAFDWGLQALGNEVTYRLMNKQPDSIDQPFLPVAIRYESIGNAPAESWFSHSVMETFELTRSYSTIFNHDLARLRLIADHPNAAPAILRSLVLAGVSDGHDPEQFHSAMTALHLKEPDRHMEWVDALSRLGKA